jgi:hypothetical protein
VVTCQSFWFTSGKYEFPNSCVIYRDARTIKLHQNLAISMIVMTVNSIVYLVFDEKGFDVNDTNNHKYYVVNGNS